MEPIHVDGSLGEGGGQLARLSAALSVVICMPVKISNIRAGRRKPGLGAQHAAALRILARVCGARTEGVHVGSQSIVFEPGDGGEMDIDEDVGTAGSVPLILQAVLPAVALSGRHARLKIRGGTDVPWSPTLDYITHVFVPALEHFGVRASVRARRRGYYPRGGGLVEVDVKGHDAVPVSFHGKPEKYEVRCVHSGLDGAEDEARKTAEALEKTGLPVSFASERAESAGPGGSLLARAAGGGCVAGADSLWNGGFDDAAGRLSRCLSVDENLSDMLVLPACAINGTSSWAVSSITPHLESALRVAAAILGSKYGVGKISGGYEVRFRS